MPMAFSMVVASRRETLLLRFRKGVSCVLSMARARHTSMAMSAIALELALIVFLLIVNGIFSMSEMAVVSSRKARLQQLFDEGRAGAGTALELANNPSHFLSTVQVGITIIGITSGAFGEATLSAQVAAWLSQYPAVAPHAKTIAVTIVVVGITIGSLIIGELVPKRLALLNPEAVASSVARPMSWLSATSPTPPPSRMSRP